MIRLRSFDMRAAANGVLNALFPPQCLACDAIVPTHGTLCQPCWQDVHFITEPMCACCGLPFDFDMASEGSLCGACIHERPEFSRARAVFRYDGASRRLVMRLKYQDELSLAVTYGAWLAKAGRELADASELIVPVPLHYRRFVARRYNQAALLSRALSRTSGLRELPDALLRVRSTRKQTGLSALEREKNVQGAFKPNPKRREALRGKAVLLVDDVYTTGATVEACAKALLKAGAGSVNVLTLARRGM